MPTKEQLYKRWESEYEFPETRHPDDPGYRKPTTSEFFNIKTTTMTLQEKINADLKSAMLSKNEFQKSILRVLIGELNRVDKVVGDDKVQSIIKKMIENAKIIGNTSEVDFLEKYLPQQLSEVELRNAITNHVNSNGYTVKEMGKVMLFLKETFAGQYDGKLASTIVKEILA